MTTITTKPVHKFTSIKQIEVQFAKTTKRIKEALIRNKIDVVSLIEQLCAISAVNIKDVPLFDEDVFDKVTSIGEFWRRLRKFWNIFDYDLLCYVIEVSECREAEEIFEDFLSKIDPSSIEDVDLVLHCKVQRLEGLLKPMLRIKVNTEKCTSNVKKMVEEVLFSLYELKKYSLCFRGIKEGCIEFLYYITQPLKKYLLEFTITKSNLADFRTHYIISLHIDEFELKVPSKIIDITVSTYYDYTTLI